MKFKGTAFFAALVVAFVVYIYFFEIKKPAEEETVKEEQSHVVPFKQDDVNDVKIEFNNVTIEAQKGATGEWQITQPLTDLADNAAVNSFIGSIEEEKTESTVEEGDKIDLAPFGLAPPKGKITLTSKSKTIQILVSANTGMGGKKYIKKADENKVYLASSSWDSLLAKSAKDLRDKRVMRKPKDTIKSIKITNSSAKNKSTVVLTKEGATWKTTGAAVDLDPQAVDSYLSDVAQLKAADFINDEKQVKTVKASSKLVQVEFEFTDNSKWSFWETTPNENKSYIFVSDRPIVYEAPAAAAEKLNREVADFRDKKKPFEFAKDSVGSISVKTGLAQVDLQKANDKWEQKNPDPKKEVDAEKVTALLDKISSLRVQKYMDKGSQVKSAKGEITLKDKAGLPLFEIKWSEATGDPKVMLVKTNKSNEVVGVDATLVSSMPTQTLLRDKDIAPTAAAGAGGSASQIPGVVQPKQAPVKK